MFRYVPIAGIDGFGETEIERQLRNDLPAKTCVETATKTIHGRDGVSIKHVVLVGVDAVGPLFCIKPLKSQFDAKWWSKVES